MTAEHKQAASVTSVDQVNVTTTLLSGRWLVLARVVWVGIAVLSLGLVIASIPSYFAFLHVLCTGALATCRNNGQITPDDLRALQALGLSLDSYATYLVALYIVFTVGYATIGAVIFWRKSDDRMALFASLTLIMFPAGFNSSELATLPSAWSLPGQFVALPGQYLFVPLLLPVSFWAVCPALDALALGRSDCVLGGV